MHRFISPDKCSEFILSLSINSKFVGIFKYFGSFMKNFFS